MLPLANKDLPQDIQEVIQNLQIEIDNETSFSAKAEKAKQLWKSKGGVLGEKAFEAIRKLLTEMCVGTEICNYCEGSEANDIEHIYPKSFFPEYTFDWENYLLVCKQCNTGYKLDKCFVMDSEGNIFETIRGTEPLHKTVAIINPRKENPQDFFYLNTKTWTFEPIFYISLANKNKAEKTLEILALNERDYLKVARESAAIEYFNYMDRLCKILQATSHEEIKNALSPYENQIEIGQNIADFKNEKRISVKKEVQNHRHPSVWYAIKTIDSKISPKWQNIFAFIPEALTW